MHSSIHYPDNQELDRIDFALTHYRHLVRLREYVENNINSPFQLTDIADRIGISASRLSHLFRDKTGISYSNWIRYTRIERATRLLEIDDRAISDVAAAVGYENARTFERSFKKITGITATVFRESTISQSQPRI
jgi:two-component system response regulator YesN